MRLVSTFQSAVPKVSHEMRFVPKVPNRSKRFQKFQKVPNCRDVWVGVCAKAGARSWGEEGEEKGGKREEKKPQSLAFGNCKQENPLMHIFKRYYFN